MIQEIIKNDLCVSCGLCTLDGGAEMVQKRGVDIPFFDEPPSKQTDDFLSAVCPGRGYPLVETGRKLFESNTSEYDYRVGHYNAIGAARTLDKVLLKESTSGGMMPMLANWLIENKKVDGVLTVKFRYTENGPEPEPYIARTKEELTLSQGSKYRPVALFKNIDELLAFSGTLAVIGTPCQIAGIKQAQQQNQVLKDKIKYTIANFCGGYRDYRETERIFDINEVDRSKIEKFSYRGNGQPGTMSILQTEKPAIELKYPDYARLTGYIKYKRCKLCVDATGELADVSFGDAWLPKFLNTGNKWSFYISRSIEMREILEEIKALGTAEFQDITLDELLESQHGNLTTKKERQKSRFKLYRMMGKKIPEFDGGYNQNKENLKLELKVHITSNLMYLLEKMGLYLFFAKKTKRIK